MTETEPQLDHNTPPPNPPPNPPPPPTTTTTPPTTPAPLAADSTARSFSRGFGFLLQGYGAVILLFMACTCAGIAFFEADAWQSGGQAEAMARQLTEDPKSNEPALIEDPATISRRATTVFLLGSALSAFCLVGFGLGMQTDRGAFPALGAGITNTAMILAYGYVSWQLLSASAAWWEILLPTLLLGVAALLSLFSYTALAEVLRNPPSTTRAPTVPAEAFPDHWATTKSADASYDQPLQESISKQRERLRKQLEELESLEKRLDGNSSSRNPKQP